MKRRVAITGYGVVCPLGNSAQDAWNALIAGKSGIGPITHFDASAYTSKVAGEVKNFDPATTGLEAKDIKRTDRFIQLGMAATREAMAQAGLLGLAEMPKAFRERVATVLGTGIGGIGSIETAQITVGERGPGRLSPFFIPAMLPNLLAGQASMLYGAQGPNVCPVSACATSAHALGWGKRLIEWGEADICIAGGAEAAITPTSVGGFAAMRALSTAKNDAPEQASRPFDKDRDGFVIGEGAAVMILEAEETAKARGAAILGYLDGFGQSADAANLTLPAEHGEGAQRAMKLALQDAGLDAGQVGYVNAHATSTPAGDDLEAEAIQAVFGGFIPVSSTKGATGHLLGGAGALEAVFSLQAIQHQMLPPTLNLSNTTCTAEHNAVTLIGPQAVKANAPLKTVLSNSFGFGGTNAALVVCGA